MAKPGDVDTLGRINLTNRQKVSCGVVCVNLEQALNAKKYGWEIVPGTVHGCKAPDFVMLHVRKAG